MYILSQGKDCFVYARAMDTFQVESVAGDTFSLVAYNGGEITVLGTYVSEKKAMRELQNILGLLVEGYKGKYETPEDSVLNLEE